MSGPEYLSKTPILDLEQPLPAPKHRTSSANVVILLTVIAVFTVRSLIPVVVVFDYFLIALALAVVHEFGHWLAGRCVGLRLSYLVIGPLKFVRNSGQWRVYYRPYLTGGFIRMSLDKVRRVRWRLIILVLGGPAASLVTGAIALVACRAQRVGGTPSVGLPVAAFAILSLLAGIQSFRNLKFRGYSGDGAILRVLLSSYEGAKQQIAAHGLYMLETGGRDVCLWNRRWMSMASVKSELYPTSFHSDWLQYHLSSDPHLAGKCLERCLAGLALLPPDQREENLDQMFLESAAFMAWHRDDPDKAQVWFDGVTHPERASPMLRRRVRIALNCARREFTEALAELDEGLSLLDQGPAGTGAERLKCSWKEWRSDIRTKRDETILGDALATNIASSAVLVLTSKLTYENSPGTRFDTGYWGSPTLCQALRGNGRALYSRVQQFRLFHHNLARQ